MEGGLFLCRSSEQREPLVQGNDVKTSSSDHLRPVDSPPPGLLSVMVYVDFAMSIACVLRLSRASSACRAHTLPNHMYHLLISQAMYMYMKAAFLSMLPVDEPRPFDENEVELFR